MPSLSEGYDFYAEGRSDGRVHLYIRNVTVTFVNSIQFCCELPNINDLVQNVCVYLGKCCISHERSGKHIL